MVAEVSKGYEKATAMATRSPNRRRPYQAIGSPDREERGRVDGTGRSRSPQTIREVKPKLNPNLADVNLQQNMDEREYQQHTHTMPCPLRPLTWRRVRLKLSGVAGP